MTPICSIIIPTYQHAEYLRTAVISALDQTVPCEVIVVDDGSTDATQDVLWDFGPRIRVLIQPNLGVAAARNAGIEFSRGRYLQFLDADDTLEPKKVERQLLAFEDPSTGWVLCDVRILDAVSNTDELASRRYGYGAMNLCGSLAAQLERRNFIPIHSPLVRRSAIGRIRFPAGALEDWAFWRQLAAVSSCCYVPQVLATYHHRRTGRSRRK